MSIELCFICVNKFDVMFPVPKIVKAATLFGDVPIMSFCHSMSFCSERFRMVSFRISNMWY